jgi:hypothetical protein
VCGALRSKVLRTSSKVVVANHPWHQNRDSQNGVAVQDFALLVSKKEGMGRWAKDSAWFWDGDQASSHLCCKRVGDDSRKKTICLEQYAKDQALVVMPC